jgi:hypothetical protein
MKLQGPAFLFFGMLSFFCAKAQDVWHARTLPVQAFQEDFAILDQFIRDHHGGTFQYVDENHLDEVFNELHYADAPLAYRDAFLRVVNYIDVLRDGHTWAMPDESISRQILQAQRFFPLTLEVQDDAAYIAENYSIDPKLTKGAKVLRINGSPMIRILHELSPYLTADGYSESGKWGVLQGQFWWYYGLHYGFPDTHEIEVLTTEAELLSICLPSVYMSDLVNDASELYWRNAKSASDTHTVHFRVQDNVGILKVNSFAGQSLRAFRHDFEAALELFADQKCEQMVIDVRGNSGGREGVENLLLSCFEHSLEEKYDAVCIKRPRATAYRYIEHGTWRWMEDLLYRTVEFRRDEEGNWQRRERFERTFFQPEHRFIGPVMVLIDRHVFSGASEFAALAADYGTNCTLIGEETCGGYAGHTSGYYYKLVLPNTGITVQVPRIWFDLNTQEPYLGGVKPDIALSLPHIAGGNDPLLEYVLNNGKELAERAFTR